MCAGYHSSSRAGHTDSLQLHLISYYVVYKASSTPIFFMCFNELTTRKSIHICCFSSIRCYTMGQVRAGSGSVLETGNLGVLC